MKRIQIIVFAAMLAFSGISAAQTIRGVDSTGHQRTILTDTSGRLASMFDNATRATADAAAKADGAQVMAKARSSQITAVDNNDAIQFITNLYGELVLAGYTWATTSIRTEEINPLSDANSTATLCDLSGIADSTTDYCGYIDLTGYRSLSIQCVATTTPTDTTTYTVECSADPETTPASATYLDVTTAFLELGGNDHNASYVDETTILSLSNTALHWCRVKYVVNAGGGNDGAITCHYKVMY